MFRLLLLMLFFGTPVLAQSSQSDSLFVPGGLRMSKFNLPRQADKILEIYYEKNGEPVKGNLTPDGNAIIVENYRKGQRIKVKLLFHDGGTEEITKTSCYIDPYNPEL